MGAPSAKACGHVTKSLTPMTSSTLLMETPTAFDHSIRFSVTFDRAIAGLPPAFLGLPTTREVFESTAACKARLQGFSLGQVFAVVVGKSNKNSFVKFLCIHHSAETRNDRQLGQDIERDPEGEITSRRKRGDIQVIQKLDCKWRCICSFKFAYIGATCASL